MYSSRPPLAASLRETFLLQSIAPTVIPSTAEARIAPHG